MKRTRSLISPALVFGLAVLNFCRQADSRAAEPGKPQVETASFEWLDKTRNREVPVKVYFPKSEGPFPVIIFSHGLGGSRNGYEYLGRHWAGHGYVSVHLQHKGSDEAVWKGNSRPAEALRKSVLDLRNSVNRPFDVRFAIDQLEKIHRDKTPLGKRLDLTRIGMAGHSYGAWTTLAVAGEVFVGPLGTELSAADPRVKAAVPMSAPVPQKDKLDQAFAKIKIPCLHMTGTLDDSPIGETKASERRLPFDHTHGADQYLITFTGGDHMIFSGRARLPGARKDKAFQDLICTSSTAFWDAYLKDDARAKAFLSGGGFEKALGEEGKLEVRLKKKDHGAAAPMTCTFEDARKPPLPCPCETYRPRQAVTPARSTAAFGSRHCVSRSATMRPKGLSLVSKLSGGFGASLGLSVLRSGKHSFSFVPLIS